jgi:hypothetical protein
MRCPTCTACTDRVSTQVVAVLVSLALVFHVALLYWPYGQGASRTEADSTSIDELHQTPVFQLLQATHDRMQFRGSSLKHSARRLHLQPQCQLQESQLQEVTTAAVAFATAPSQPDSSDEARDAALVLRSIMLRAWVKVLQPFSQPVQGPGANSRSKCKSVGLNPRPARRFTSKADDIKHSTALVLVLGDWASLERLLKLYAINLFSIWCYARQHGYGLELYVHDEPLPHSLPIYYIKVTSIRTGRTVGSTHHMPAVAHSFLAVAWVCLQQVPDQRCADHACITVPSCHIVHHAIADTSWFPIMTPCHEWCVSQPSRCCHNQSMHGPSSCCQCPCADAAFAASAHRRADTGHLPTNNSTPDIAMPLLMLHTS